MNFEFISDSTTARNLVMKAPLIPGGTYSLVCLGGSFRDIYGSVTISTNYRFAVATEEDYGSIRANCRAMRKM
ncbi:MAG: hypothetical protein U5L72_17610 [Bacteroidales bacterium]|nr:hypothetical protein [Bacteroidales bacterium]